MNHCELISFLKNTIFFYLWTKGEEWRWRGFQVQVQSWRQMKLTDNIFAYHTFIYIRKKAKVNLELRVKEPAPPSPALSEFKKIFSHTRLKLPPLGFTSLTLSLEPALLLKFVIPFEICNSKTWFLPSESFSCWPPKESEVEILAWGVPPPLFLLFCCFGICEGWGGGPPHFATAWSCLVFYVVRNDHKSKGACNW